MAPKHTLKPRKTGTRSALEFWVLDTAIEGSSKGTLEARGPFRSQAQAEQWIKETSASDWVGSCGCLRTGAPEKWGDVYVIAQAVRKVRPVPPTSVAMALVDVGGNAKLTD